MYNANNSINIIFQLLFVQAILEQEKSLDGKMRRRWKLERSSWICRLLINTYSERRLDKKQCRLIGTMKLNERMFKHRGEPCPSKAKEDKLNGTRKYFLLITF